MPTTGDTVTVRDLVTGALSEVTLGRLLGHGAYRSAFDCGDGLVAKCEGNATANTREVDCWLDCFGGDASAYLCPIVAANDDGTVIVQQRAANTFDDATSELSEYYYNRMSGARSRYEEEKIEQEYREQAKSLWDGLSRFTQQVGEAFHAIGYDAHDLHDANVGVMRDGTMTVIDYGNFMQRRTER